MIKNDFLNIASRIHLGGSVTQILWEVINGKLFINFQSTDSSELIGEIKCDMPDFPSGKFGIYNLTEFIKYVGLLGDSFDIKVKNNTKQVEQIKFTSNNMNVDFRPSLVEVIPKALKFTPKKQMSKPIVIKPDAEFISSWVKICDAATQIHEATSFRVKSNKNTVTFEFGSKQSNTSKINLEIEGEIPTVLKEIPFNSELTKNVLKANKNFDNFKWEIYQEGLSRMFFDEATNNLNLTYTQVRIK